MSEKNGARREPLPRKDLLNRTTPVRNVILDEWMVHLTPAELKVVLYVERKTRGWGREWDQIDVEQMMRGVSRKDGTRLDRGTGLGRTACRGAIRSLVARGALERREVIAENGASEPPWYSVNASWSPSGVPKNGTARRAGVSENRQGRVPESDGGRVSENRQGGGVENPTGGRVPESDPHKRYSPLSPLGGEDGTGEVSPTLWSAQKEVGEQKGTPQTSSSSSGKGKETRPTDDDYDAQVRRKAELVALGADAPREPRGSEEELDGWRDLEARTRTIPLQECDWLAEDFAERFAPRLRLENKVEGLQQVHEWVVRQNRDGFKPVWLVALRCAAEQEKGTVRHAWSHFLAAVANEWNDNIRLLAQPFTDEVLSARVEAEETTHALEVLRNLPGWPPNTEKEVSDLVVKCLWNEEYLFSDMLAGYEAYVQRIGGLQNAKIEGEPAGALEHLEWFTARYWESLDDKEFTPDGRLKPHEVAANTV